MGDLTAVEVLARFSMLVRVAGDEQQGRVIKQIGDEFMLVFGDPVAAVRCALDIQRRVADEPRFLGTRVGVHVGPVLYRQGDYFGATVNLAARLTSTAARDQVLVSHSVRLAIEDDPDLRIVPLGMRDLKGIDDDVEVFEVRRQADAGAARFRDPVCEMVLLDDEIVARVEFDGHVHVFCSAACLRQFSTDPERFARRYRAS